MRIAIMCVTVLLMAQVGCSKKKPSKKAACVKAKKNALKKWEKAAPQWGRVQRAWSEKGYVKQVKQRLDKVFKNKESLQYKNAYLSFFNYWGLRVIGAKGMKAKIEKTTKRLRKNLGDWRVYKKTRKFAKEAHEAAKANAIDSEDDKKQFWYGRAELKKKQAVSAKAYAATKAAWEATQAAIKTCKRK